MADTTITVQDVADKTPLEFTDEAVAATMEFVWSGRDIILVRNGATSMTVTVLSQDDCSQGFDHDTSQVVGANEDWVFSAASSRFKDSSGLVQLTFSDIVDGDIAVIKLPN